jgi:hypothetical protein
MGGIGRYREMEKEIEIENGIDMEMKYINM